VTPEAIGLGTGWAQGSALGEGAGVASGEPEGESEGRAATLELLHAMAQTSKTAGHLPNFS
jgi:hypothetical protein